MANTFNEWVDLREQEFDPRGSVAPQALGVAKGLRSDPRKQAIAQMAFLKAFQQVAINDPSLLTRVITVLKQGLKNDPDLADMIQKAKQGMRQFGQQHQAAPDPAEGMPTAAPQPSMLAGGPTRGIQPR